MKRMKKMIAIAVAGVAVTTSTLAQAPGCNCSDEAGYLSYQLNGLAGIEYRNPVDKYKGEQYYAPWSEGGIELSNGQELAGVYLRYDMYLNRLLWMREKEYKTGILPVEDVVRFTIPGIGKGAVVTFVRKRIRLPYLPDTSTVYVRVLAEGPLSLYSCHLAVESPSEYELVDNSRYLAFRGTEYVYMKLRRGVLLKLPYIDPVKMKEVLKANKIRVHNNELQMARAFTLYNQAVMTK